MSFCFFKIFIVSINSFKYSVVLLISLLSITISLLIALESISAVLTALDKGDVIMMLICFSCNIFDSSSACFAPLSVNWTSVLPQTRSSWFQSVWPYLTTYSFKKSSPKYRLTLWWYSTVGLVTLHCCYANLPNSLMRPPDCSRGGLVFCFLRYRYP
jgi:hypothetical protein